MYAHTAAGTASAPITLTKENAMTTATAPIADETLNAGWVKLARLGGQTAQIDLVPGTTVRDVLGMTDTAINQGDIVQVNGVPVTDLNTVLEPNSAVQITTAIRNG